MVASPLAERRSCQVSLSGVRMRQEFAHTSIRVPGAAVCFVALLAALTQFFWTLPGSWFGDLGSFIESGWAGRTGLNPYAMYPLSHRAELPGFYLVKPNTNPPISVLFFELFTFARPEVVLRQWYLISFALYAILVWGMVRRFDHLPRRVVILWMMGLAPFWDSLALGQIYVPLAILAVLGWILIEERRVVLAGLCIGLLVSFRPQFVFWPLLLLCARQMSVGLTAFGTAVGVSLVPVFLFGVGIYRQWFSTLNPALISFPTNMSFPGLFSRLGMYYLALALMICLAVFVVVWVCWRRPEAIKVSELALVTVLLAFPLSWMHSALFIIPLILRRWSDEYVRLVAFALVVPVHLLLVVLGRDAWIHFTVGGIYNWALVLLAGLIFGETLRDFPRDLLVRLGLADT